MLSIGRRGNTRVFREDLAFRHSEQGWPNWSELGPILLRSAGIAGLAGIIMMIAAGDVIFTDPLRAQRAQSEAVDDPGEQALAARHQAPVQDASSGDGQAVQDEPAAVESVTADVISPNLQGLDEFGTHEPLAFVRASAPGDAEPALLNVEGVGTFAPGFTQAPATIPGADVGASEQAGSLPPDLGLRRQLVDVADQGEPDREEPPAEAEPEVVAMAVDSPNAVGSIEAPGASEDPPAWANEAAACPRDWLAGEAQGDADDAAVDCEPADETVALASTPEAAEGEEGEGLHEALESAAASHALKLTGFVARLPLVRPDPPAWALRKTVRRARNSRRRADWPDEPPPDCGNLHAYWRYVDRKRGTKEWHCR